MSWRPQPMPPTLADRVPSANYGISEWCAYNEQHSGQKCRENRLPETRTGSGLDGDNPPIPADLTLPARP